MQAKKKNEFRVALSSVGTDMFYSSYGVIKDANACTLLRNTIALIAENFVGKEAHVSLVYETCVDILKRIMKPDVDINKRIREWNTTDIKRWDIAQE